MFTIYIDDSGTDPKQHVAIATALIIPAIQIVRFQNEWDKFQKKEGFECFHTSVFYFRNPKREFANWDDVKRGRVFKRVCQISKKFGARAISIAVNKKDYDTVVPRELRTHLGDTHYGWAVRQLLANVDVLYSLHKSQPREFVFQWVDLHDPARQEIENIMDQLLYLAERDGKYSDHYPDFKPSEGIPGLQCVDLISWVSYQFALKIYKKLSLRELVPEAWRFFEGHLGSDGWLRAWTLKKENLEKSIKKAISEGKAAQFFDEWTKARG